MGAGSTIVTEAEKKRFYEDSHPRKKEVHCKYHLPRVLPEFSNCHFLNTGKPYCIEECPECKRQYVREL